MIQTKRRCYIGNFKESFPKKPMHTGISNKTVKKTTRRLISWKLGYGPVFVGIIVLLKDVFEENHVHFCLKNLIKIFTPNLAPPQNEKIDLEPALKLEKMHGSTALFSIIWIADAKTFIRRFWLKDPLLRKEHGFITRKAGFAIFTVLAISDIQFFYLFVVNKIPFTESCRKYFVNWLVYQKPIYVVREKGNYLGLRNISWYNFWNVNFSPINNFLWINSSPWKALFKGYPVMWDLNGKNQSNVVIRWTNVCFQKTLKKLT